MDFISDFPEMFDVPEMMNCILNFGLHQSEGRHLGEGVASDKVHKHNFGRLSS